MGNAKYHSIVMRTITLHTIHVGALENYTESNNIKKNVNRTLIGNRGHGKIRRNVTVIFANIRTSKSTCYLLYDKFHSKTHTTKFHFQFCFKFWLHQLKK